MSKTGKPLIDASSELVQAKLKKAFQLGLEIGYFNHSEGLGWVEEEKEELFNGVDDPRITTLILKKYDEGKEFGRKKAAKDRAKALSSTLGMIEKKKAPDVKSLPGNKKKPSEGSRTRIHTFSSDVSEDEGEVEEKVEKTLEVIRGLFNKDAKFRLYKEALDSVWDDGKITSDEQNMLNRLQESLGMVNPLKKVFEKESLDGIELTKEIDEENKEKIYETLLREAWKDGVLTYDEEELLERIRRSLGIALERHHDMYHRIRREMHLKKEEEKS